MRSGGNSETSGSPTLTRVEVVFLFYAGGAPGQVASLASRTFSAVRGDSTFQEMKAAVNQGRVVCFVKVSAFRYLTFIFSVC